MADDANANDFFGYSVAISGDYAIVGAKNEDGGNGAAHVFHRTGVSAWDAGVKLVAPDAQAVDWFGTSVAICGDYAIIGASEEDGGDGDPLSRAGAAYVFHRTGVNTWDTGTKIMAPDAQVEDHFGWSVAISGDYAIIGASEEDGGDGDPLSRAGAVYVFRRNVNTWEFNVKLVAPDAQAVDWFGWSVAISGDYAIVGAGGEDGGDGDPIENAGAAYVFRRTGVNIWDAGVKLVALDAQARDAFGDSVAISADYAIVGAYQHGGVGGAAYVFHRTGVNTWDTGAKIMAPDAQANDRFGESVAISGDYAIVGTRFENGGDGDPLVGVGAAYVFRRTGVNTWDSGAKIMAPDAQVHDEFGNSVAISGDYAIVGAAREDGGDGDPLSDAGAAYIY
jgi:hypothetical protein